MNVTEFDEKYKDKGGIEELTKMRALLFTRKAIAEHFGVANDRVRQWMHELFGGKGSDNREDRKKAIMNSMMDFAVHNGILDFKVSYFGSQYYEEVLKKIQQHDVI